MSEQQAADARDHAAIDLDPSQREAVERGGESSFAVLGAPGSGRTETLVELVARRIEQGVKPDQVVAIAANRRLAADLRDRIEQRIRVAAAGGTLGRTAASIAIEIIAEDLARRGEQPPRLLTGSQQDDIIADLIAGRLDETAPGAARRPQDEWPSWFGAETLQLRGFRDELRALIGAMAEEAVTPERLAELAVDPEAEPGAGTRHRALWRGAARIAQEYFDVLDRAYEGSYDSAQALSEAARLLLERDGVGGRRVFDRVRLLVIDDAQELTEPARRLVRAFERRGAQVVAFGDPDIATGSFHGGRAELAANWRDPGEPAPERLVLDRVHRHGPTLRGVVQRIGEGLATGLAGTQRRAPAAAADAPGPGTASPEGAPGPRAAAGRAEHPPVAAQAIASSEVEETSLITGYLRRLHLLEGIPWGEMAVIARSGARLPGLARGFDRAGIPTTTSTPVPAAEDAAVRAIIALGESAVAGGITPIVLQSVLRSPLFQVDPLELRRLRRRAYLRDLEGAGRAGADVLADAVNARLRGEADPAGDALLESAEAAGGRGLRQVLEVLTRMTGRLRAGDPIDTVLYEAWRDERRAERWQRIALGHEAAALTMNRRLDALVVLFDRAKRFVEREPHASLESFLADWHRDSVVDDTLASGAGAEAVALTTPAGAVGHQWRIVVVAGVNEGVWPNLRVRDTLLGAGRLGEALDHARGGAAASILDRRAEVLADETRMLLSSCSKASERLLVTAVADEDAQPSRYLHRLGLPTLAAAFAFGDVASLGYDDLGIEALVAALRREAAGERCRPEALAALARLARADVPGARPDSWFGTRGRSTEAPLVQPEDGELPLRLYPSGIDRFLDCGVAWFVDQYSGSAPSDAMTLGNILHLAAEREAEFEDRGQMMDFAERLLREMTFDADWIRDIQVRIARSAAESLWSYLRRDGVRAVGNETSFEFVIEEELDAGARAAVTVAGRIDRLEQTGTGLRIIDIKTGTVAPSKDSIAQNRQLLAYQLAHREGAIEGEARTIELESAALLFPRKSSGRGANKVPWSLYEQHRQSDAELAGVREEFVDAALGQAGFARRRASSLDAPPRFLADHAAHCSNAGNSCHIHSIAEVTE
ncbi:UvrD-helicase domain-containing protein [Gulosibacter sp. 10]|uniref:PD-(D/E)XK nuclease family protein n=1 Tax=Gulosibacter sp. 10 TaxID=1255570 RepID=UPI00097EC536|nr:UvrD-helicase domain-containing protein [Gulosibacter sp. 10]SJM56914.1 ATP-dependent DNA helicase SCO5183 [Gulosibacter sp. 10]